MINAKFQVKEVGKENSERIYSDLDELYEDFPLEDEEITLLYKGRDLEKWWAKREWMITIMDPED